jgi:hypothetical protein
MRSHTQRHAIVVLSLVAVLLSAASAGAQSVLLVVVEAVDTQALPPPLAVREGLSASLFDAGCVVLDSPGSPTLPKPAEAARMARAAGADIALEVSTRYADTNLGVDLLRISARTTYLLIDSSTSGVLTTGTRDATNRDRERDTSRAALGTEIGKDVAQAVREFLDHRAKGG